MDALELSVEVQSIRFLGQYLAANQAKRYKIIERKLELTVPPFHIAVNGSIRLGSTYT